MPQGNKKAEELERLIRETQKKRADPNIPANPKYRKEKDK